MDRCGHHRSKWGLAVERRSRAIPVEIAPGVGQREAKVIAQHIHVKRVHEDGENQSPDHRDKDRAAYIPLDLASDIRRELETDELEENHTNQPTERDQAGK